MFDLIDTNGNGLLEVDEITAALVQMGESAAQVQQRVELIKKDKINLEEFRSLVSLFSPSLRHSGKEGSAKGKVQLSEGPYGSHNHQALRGPQFKADLTSLLSLPGAQGPSFSLGAVSGRQLSAPIKSVQGQSVLRRILQD